ncbi:MAG: hypothetical protein P8J55_11445 [Pseudomonadales bacterium]|nr:hypothetical protein [Pseudomonadales bacterium]
MNVDIFEDCVLELFNLHDDIGERRNLKDKHPEKTRQGRDMLVAWRKDIGAPVPPPPS